MTEVPTPSVPKIIVVAEEEVHTLLRDSGAQWDVQHRVSTVAQMWNDLETGLLDANSVAIVFSDSVPVDQAGELEVAVAAMAPAAATFVVGWRRDNLDLFLATVKATAAAAKSPAAPVYMLPTTSAHQMLDAVRTVCAQTATTAHIAFPAQWPLADAPVGGGPVPAVVAAPAAVAPVAVAPAPVATPVAAPVAPAPVQPVAPAPVAHAPAPVHTPAPAPTYTPPQPNYASGHGDQPDPLAKPILPGQVTMAVTSSKGGSGKSTTAMMLAATIAHSSKKAFEAGLIERPLKVCLVDMDTRDGQVASLIGCYVPTALNIRILPRWDEEAILSNLVHDPKLGIDALLAPVRPRTAEDVGPDFYRHVIRTLKTTHDVVIMDTSVNYLDPLISTVCLPESTAILFVTTLATTSVQGMARALREITDPVDRGGMGIKTQKIGIVVNQAVTEVGMDREQVIEASLKVPIVGAIPLATKDVLTATNFNRMHHLLKHTLLGPAYYKLAAKCMHTVNLVPLIDDGSAPKGAAAAAPMMVDGAEAPAEAHDTEHAKRRRFGRRS